MTNVALAQSAIEIEQAKQIIKENNLSEEDVRNEARKRGFSDQQIDKVIDKEKSSRNITKKDGLDKVPNKVDFGQTNKLENNIDISIDNQTTEKENLGEIPSKNLSIIEDKESEILNTFENKELPFFGYDIFKRDPALFQASSIGMIEPGYIIGPGDEIIIMVWGETQFRNVLEVDREGFIFMPEIGQIFVNGLTLDLLESKLFRVISQAYESLNPLNKKSTTFLDVSLGNLRPLRIQVLGEINQPGAYTVNPSATLFSSLYYFNGPTTFGSLRDIKLIRGEKEVATIDFYDFLLTGKKLKDVKLQLDDVVFIPNRLKTVTIDGEVHRPGIYELKPDETIIDIINMAGNLKITAYLGRAQIDRIVPFEDRDDAGMDRTYLDVNLYQIMKNNAIISVQDGDKIKIFSVKESRQNVVSLTGAIKRPGDFDLGDSLSIRELILKADGLLGDAYMKRVDIVRLKKDYTEELIKLDLEKVMQGDKENDLNLKVLDRVRVYGVSEMVPRSYVAINGHVKKPGRYLLQDNMTLYDLIFKSGGFLDEEFKKSTFLERAELIRKVDTNEKKEIITFNLGELLSQEKNHDKLLEPDDYVRIYSTEEIKGSTRYVTVSGNVKNPGIYELYESNMRLYDVLFKSGGFEDDQFKSTVYLERADLLRLDRNKITKQIIPFNLGDLLSDPSNVNNFVLLPGDEIKVYGQKTFNNAKNVNIEGAILKPGSYELKTGMTLKDLLIESGGVLEDVYRYKIEVARIDPSLIDQDYFSHTIELDMLRDYSISNVKYGLEEITGDVLVERSEFVLKPYDFIFVRADPFFKNVRQVKISGAVYYPGKYSINGPEDTIYDVILRAGGLLQNAFPFGSLFIREGKEIQVDIEEILAKKGKKSNIYVRDNDEIIIAKNPNIIEVNGEINMPGLYQFKKGLRINDVIREAGGFTQYSEKNNIYIQYANGISKKYNRFFGNHRVRDGSIINIGKEEDSEPFDKTEYAKDLTSILANFAQTLSILVIAFSSNN